MSDCVLTASEAATTSPAVAPCTAAYRIRPVAGRRIRRGLVRDPIPVHARICCLVGVHPCIYKMARSI